MQKLVGLSIRKNHLLRCWGCLFLLNVVGVLLHYLCCLKIEPLVCSVKFLSLEAALCLYKTTITPCME